MGDPVTSLPDADLSAVGVIGTGAMGTAHVDNLARWVPGAEVTQIFDVDSERAKAVAAGVGAAAAPTAEALIGSSDVDAVLIAAPDPLHEELALACLAAGKPTLLREAARHLARRRLDASSTPRWPAGSRLVQLGFMRRFDPAYVALREAVVGGGIGDRPGRPLRPPQRALPPQPHRRGSCWSTR